MDCDEAKAGAGSGMTDQRSGASRSQDQCGVISGGHSADSNSTGTSDGTGAARKPDPHLAAFDEELRRFACAHGEGDKDSMSPSGREFVFGDLVRDSRVLDAARMLAVGCADAGAVVQAAGTGKVDAPVPCGTSREGRSSRVSSEEEDLFLLRAAITHGISRLRSKGWLVLADQERDTYVYVFPPPPRSLRLLSFELVWSGLKRHLCGISAQNGCRQFLDSQHPLKMRVPSHSPALRCTLHP
jgi:hypothetical protein